jgi:hypothetical protein
MIRADLPLGMFLYPIRRLLESLEQIKNAKETGVEGVGKEASDGHVTYELFHAAERDWYERLRRIGEVEERLGYLEKVVGQPGSRENVSCDVFFSSVPARRIMFIAGVEC